MSATATRPRPRTKSSGSRKKKSAGGASGLLRWWPLLVGILIAVFVERIAATVAIVAPEAAKFVLPLPYIVKGHTFGLPASTAESISEFATFAQFPLYGFFLILLMLRLRFRFAVLWLFLLHCVAFIIAAFVLHS
jgi:hypothetical protein